MEEQQAPVIGNVETMKIHLNFEDFPNLMTDRVKINSPVFTIGTTSLYAELWRHPGSARLGNVNQVVNSPEDFLNFSIYREDGEKIQATDGILEYRVSILGHESRPLNRESFF